ncbi:HD domain-containing protein [Paraconexibacter sp. AEG42_29]|uniref:HD domain-containing protein n=1 Tax=Paraconexibacter sp. AEG42_29 TaxID=2997339 RepID=UPI00339D33B4
MSGTVGGGGPGDAGSRAAGWIAGLPVAADLRAALDFLAESHDLAYVMRLNRLRDGSRPESSAEHSWHLALCAVVLARQTAPGVDLGRVLTMLLIHDLVEIEAGDVPIYDLEERAAVTVAEERAADRIFGLLPAAEAGAFLAAWHEFEAAASDEARFARGLDRLQPMLLHAAGDGSAWAGRGVTVAQERILVAQVTEFWPALGAIAEAILVDAARRGWLAP